METERIGNTGRSDYIISALINEGGDECTRVYLWELKSPQSYLFEKDVENRLKPSSALIDAENKILHYYIENKDNAFFHRQYEITNPDDVRLGGIIIGSRNTKVNGDYDDDKKDRLFRTAKASRDIFYKNSEITLLTWDDIVGYIRLDVTKGREKISEEPISIDPDWLRLNEDDFDSEHFEEQEKYDTLEEEFSDTAFQIKIRVRCRNCHEFDTWLAYGGVVSTNQRQMGTEYMHVWNSDENCAHCGENCFLELEVWEYPMGQRNLAQTPDCTCEILNKNDIGEIIGMDVE